MKMKKNFSKTKGYKGSQIYRHNQWVYYQCSREEAGVNRHKRRYIQASLAWSRTPEPIPEYDYGFDEGEWY